MPRSLRITKTARPTSPGNFSQDENGAGLMVFDTLLWRFAAQRSYWLVSQGATPHALPVWGIWQDCAFRFNTHPDSQEGRNLRQTGSACVHLADTEAVFIMECHARELDNTEALQAFIDEYNPKYKWRFTLGDVAQGTFVLTPHTALAWTDGQGQHARSSATRWDLEVT